MPKRGLMSAKVISFIVLVVLLAILFFQNTQVVPVHLFFWTVAVSEVILLLIILGIGIIMGGVLFYVLFLRMKRR